MTTEGRPGSSSETRETHRLVVELNERSQAALDHMCIVEQLNKTNVVNRALQVYLLVSEADEVTINGERVRIV